MNLAFDKQLSHTRLMLGKLGFLEFWCKFANKVVLFGKNKYSRSCKLHLVLHGVFRFPLLSENVSSKVELVENR